jgi:acetyltransferase-like isoleucine patch superfamily enzyme
MNFLISIFYKILDRITNKKNVYFFERSKRYVSSWGKKSYGYPLISCFDGVSRLSIGSYTSIASNVSILLGSNHKMGFITTFPRSLINRKVSQEETNERGDVSIGNDVWIGYGVTIVGPVTIGDGAIIGASALVVDDIPPYAVVGGVPARVIKYRFEKEVIETLLAIQWWNKGEEKIKELEGYLYSSDVQGLSVACRNV